MALSLIRERDQSKLESTLSKKKLDFSDPGDSNEAN